MHRLYSFVEHFTSPVYCPAALAPVRVKQHLHLYGNIHLLGLSNEKWPHRDHYLRGSLALKAPLPACVMMF
jgi:hypothetical protein